MSLPVSYTHLTWRKSKAPVDSTISPSALSTGAAPISIGREPGDVIVQHVEMDIAEGAAPTSYDLQVGVYSPQDWQRLVTAQGDATRDYAIIGAVEVTQ